MKRTQMIRIVMLSMTFTMMNYTTQAETPELVYSTLLGGTGSDYGHAIAVDDEGYAYIAGQVNSSNYPTTVGAYDRTANGGSDILVTKLNQNGSALVYSTYIGGSAFDDTRKVCVDQSGCVYLTGSTESSNFPTTAGSMAGNSTSYFLKLDSAGSHLEYSSRWAGGKKIMVDHDGYLIILGSTNSATFPTTENAYSRVLAGDDDLFVAKIDITNNTIIFSTLIGGNAKEWAPSFTIDSQNNIIITGQTQSENYPVTGNTFATFTAGKSNVFVTKLKSDGTQLIYSTIVGGSDDEWSFDITADINDNVYVTGVTLSDNFPISTATFDSQFNGGQDAFLFKLNSDGNQLVYSTYIGGADKDGGRGIVVDRNGQAYLTGCTKSTDFPVSDDAYDKTFKGAGSDQWAWGDPFFLVMNPEGTQLEYSTYFGGSADEEAYGIALDQNGGVYICGITASNDFVTTEGAYSRTRRGGCDIYVAKFQFSQTIDYFGQTPPGDSAVVFAPGIVSLTNREDFGIVFTPDGSECFFETYTPGDENSMIYYAKRINEQWTEPQIAPLALNTSSTLNFISADGNRLYFSINNNGNDDLGFCERTAEGWSDQQFLPYPINTSSREEGYTQTSDGIIYFDSDRPGGYGGIDIWCKRPSSDQAENLGPVINSSTADFVPCIAPDGSYLIFSSWRSGGYTEQDLYISFNKGDQGWTAPISMEKTGAKINVPGFSQLCPVLSPDGKYLFFCHHTDAASRDVIDIYWVSTHVIVGLKKIAFTPKLNRQIRNMNITTDSTLNYIVPANTFSCEYSIETLTYSATSSDGSALPAWLTFDPQTRTLSGKPTRAGVSNIKITVTNADTISVSSTFKITVTSTTSMDESKNQFPTKLQLDQNFPNPFNPSTMIHYQLAVAGDVNLSIYNLIGQKIKILVNGFQNAGEHSVVWDGVDDSENPVCSGMYFYRLEAGQSHFHKKMMLAR